MPSNPASRAFFAAMPKSATVWRISTLVIGRGVTVGLRPDGVTLTCSGFTAEADMGNAPTKKIRVRHGPGVPELDVHEAPLLMDRVRYAPPALNLFGAPET